MNKIKQVFESRPVYAAYITAGDGDLKQQVDAVMALIGGGVNLIEIGVPFSDPIADGPVIQAAMGRALAQGTTVFDALALCQAIRSQSDIPIVLFTYYNPILATGDADFFQQAQQAGVDGLLIIDLPFEQATPLIATCQTHGIAPIAVLSPSTPAKRMEYLVTQAEGFIYYACRKGVTGVRQGLPADLKTKINEIKQITQLPVLVGFGIADAASAQAVMEVADGFVVGSHFVNALHNGMQGAALTHMTQQINPMQEVNL